MSGPLLVVSATFYQIVSLSFGKMIMSQDGVNGALKVSMLALKLEEETVCCLYCHRVQSYGMWAALIVQHCTQLF